MIFDDQSKELGEKILKRKIAGLNLTQRKRILKNYADYLLELDDVDSLMEESDSNYWVISKEKVKRPSIDRSFQKDALNNNLIFANEVSIEKIRSYN